jgi:hypothetical protein
LVWPLKGTGLRVAFAGSQPLDFQKDGLTSIVGVWWGNYANSIGNNILDESYR